MHILWEFLIPLREKEEQVLDSFPLAPVNLSSHVSWLQEYPLVTDVVLDAQISFRENSVKVLLFF